MEFDKAIRMERTSVHLNNRGLAHYHNDCLAKAKEDFDSAIDVDPNNPMLYFNRGNVFLNWKQDPETSMVVSPDDQF